MAPKSSPRYRLAAAEQRALTVETLTSHGEHVRRPHTVLLLLVCLQVCVCVCVCGCVGVCGMGRAGEHHSEGRHG